MSTPLITRCLGPTKRALPHCSKNFRSHLLSCRWASSEAHIKQPLPEGQAQQRFREFNLQGKVFAVTGGGRGLGLTMAEGLVEAGGEGKTPF